MGGKAWIKALCWSEEGAKRCFFVFRRSGAGKWVVGSGDVNICGMYVNTLNIIHGRYCMLGQCILSLVRE